MGYGVKQADVAAIKAKTDNLPSDPADESLVEAAIIAAHTTTDGKVDDVKTETDKLPGSEVSGTFSYLDTGGEQVVFTISTTSRKKLLSIFLDLATLTQGTTIRVQHKIDGSTFRTIQAFYWATTDDDGVYLNNMLTIAQDLRVTLEEDADEGEARAVPYYYILQDME